MINKIQILILYYLLIYYIILFTELCTYIYFFMHIKIILNC